MTTDHKEAQTAGSPKKRGRPAKPESDRKNTYLGFRVRDGMREKLETAAQAGGRSPSEEIERRLNKSFEDEQTERLLWPDDSARALGKAFAMTLAAARHATGEDWREGGPTSLIVAGAVRRLMDRVSRVGSTYAEMFNSARIAATADSIAQTLGDYLDKSMPPLPDQGPSIDDWTGKIVQVTEFRDAATSDILESVTEKEYDASNPEDRPSLSPEYLSAIARFKPIREKVDAETFVYWVMKDGSRALRDSYLTPAGPGPAIKPTPAGTRWATPEEIADMVDAPGQLPESIGGQAIYDDAVSGLPLVRAEKVAPEAPKAAATHKPRTIKRKIIA